MSTKNLISLIGMFGIILTLSSCHLDNPSNTNNNNSSGDSKAPVLDDLVITNTDSSSITLQKPTFSTAGNPAPTVQAYIGLNGTISVSGSTVSGSIQGPIDVSAGDNQFSSLSSSTDYHIVVVAQNTEGYSVKQITQSTPSNDATLKATSTVKGQVLLGLGTPNSALGSAVAGTVTITAAKAADISNTGSFITLFDKTDAGATTKVVKYANGGSTINFATDTAYANEAITTLDFFIIKVTAEDATTALYYKIIVTVTPLASRKR